MAYRTFIDPDFVYEITSLQINTTNIQKYITEAQKLYVEIPLGLYSTSILLDNYFASRVVENTIEWEVIEYIRQALAYYTLAVAIPNIHYKITENGVLVRSSGDNNPLDAKELDYRITMYKQNAGVFFNRVLELLDKNKHLFPHYQKSNIGECLTNNKPKSLGGILFR